MRTALLRFNGAVERDPAIDAWMKMKMQTKDHAGELGAIAQQWFRLPPLFPYSEAMIAKIGLSVLDEEAVIGTFLLNC